MVYSGILTSKPMDYTKQTTAIPDDLKGEEKGPYTDISPLLAKLLPIQQYKAARPAYS
jgi:hypothetical protein